MKTIFTIVLVAMTTVMFGSESEMQAAKKNLNQKISAVLNEDVNESGNYFEVNGIRNVKEDMKVAFYVNDELELILLRVVTDNKDAKSYMKHFFKYADVKANKVLVGQAYSIKLHLRYKGF